MNTHQPDSIDLLAHGSGLHTVNAGLKMATAAFALLACALTRNACVCLFVSAASACLTVALGRVPLAAYLLRLRMPLVFILASALTIAVDISAMPVGDWHVALGSIHLCVFADSLRRALVLTATALGAVSAMLALALSTTIGEMTTALARLHVPNLLIELMSMVYRFIFIMTETWGQLRVAAQSRLGFRTRSRSLRTLGGLMGNLLLVSLLNADNYYNALLSRGYRGRLAFLETEKPLTALHVGSALALCVAITLAWLLSR